MATDIKFVCCVSLALFVVVESVTVPVLMWSNNDLKGIDPRWASSKDVGEAFSSSVVKSESDTIVVFLQSQLGFSDLAQFGGVYGEEHAVLYNMKDLSEELSFLTIEGNVYLETPAMDTLAKNGFEISRDTPGKCDQLKKRAFFVDLPQEVITKEALEAADLAVSQTVNLLRKCGVSFTVVYTSSAPVLDAHPHYVRRPLSEFFSDNSSNSTNTTPHELFFVVDGENTTCLMLYLTELTYFEINGTKINDHSWNSTASNETVTSVNGVCMKEDSCVWDNSTGFASLSFNTTRTTDQTSDDTIEFVFPCNESGYWNIDVILTLDGLPPVSLPMVRRDGIMLAIPLDLSYHCSNELLWTNLYPVNDSSETTYYGVKITGLQVQAYKGISIPPGNDTQSGNGTVMKYEFATAYDCQPYVSEAVWMGIVCVLPLFLMLYCSMAFMFQMETMDKFDDPRGRTISVASGR